MADMNSLVPIVDAAIAVSGNITNLITRAKASGVVQRAQLQLLRAQTGKVLADSRAYHAGELVIANLEQLARTQEYIDNLQRQGRLHGAALEMAMEQLEDLNDMLRRNLRYFENREMR